MFTGLIEEIGAIRSVAPLGYGRRITVEAKKIIDGLKIDDSVSINGVCQTVVSISGYLFTVEAVEETLSKTTLGALKSNSRVNLERALTLSTRLGGHLVQGHVDTTGVVHLIEKLSAGTNIWFSYDISFDKYLVPTGSICIDGVSLTTARVEQGRFMVSLIPHTLKSSTLSELKHGSKVNLEFDIIGKYIEKLLNSNNSGTVIDKKNSILNNFISQPMI